MRAAPTSRRAGAGARAPRCRAPRRRVPGGAPGSLGDPDRAVVAPGEERAQLREVERALRVEQDLGRAAVDAGGEQALPARERLALLALEAVARGREVEVEVGEAGERRDRVAREA